MVRSSLTYFVLGALFYFGNFVNYGIAQRDSCQTPDQIDGICTVVKQCQPMRDLSNSLERPVSPLIAEYLKEYKCGSPGRKVCCPPGPIVLPQLFPPDITNHTNLRLLPETCGYFKDENRIVNGQNAGLTEFPWMALLKYKTGFGCGGTIIHKNYILTAAHCLEGELVSVRVGEYNINDDPDCELQLDMSKKCNPPVQDLEIEEIIPHPRYGGRRASFKNDIALIRVSTINLEVENARPVCLPITKIVRDHSYSTVKVTGWGVSNITTRATSEILQKVGLYVDNKQTCIMQYRRMGLRITYTQQCVRGTTNQDSCSGDSGGPMLVPRPNSVYIQYGIVSFGSESCGSSSYPAVYTLVKYYMDWILDNIKP